MAYYDTQQMEEICCWNEQDQDRHLGCEFNMLQWKFDNLVGAWLIFSYEWYSFKSHHLSKRKKKEEMICNFSKSACEQE